MVCMTRITYSVAPWRPIKAATSHRKKSVLRKVSNGELISDHVVGPAWHRDVMIGHVVEPTLHYDVISIKRTDLAL